MSPSDEGLPFIKISRRPGEPIAIRVHHYGRVSSILNHFPDAVLVRAVNKSRTREEDQILNAARSLSGVARRIVEQHVIYQRAVKIQEQMHQTALRSIKVRRFPSQQNSRLPLERQEGRPEISPAKVREQTLSLTQLYAREVGAAPYQPPLEDRSRTRGR
jgi:hypothetical protein